MNSKEKSKNEKQYTTQDVIDLLITDKNCELIINKLHKYAIDVDKFDYGFTR